MFVSVLSFLVTWIILLILDKLALALLHWEESQKNKRIQRFIQKEKTRIGETYPKDQDDFSKMFEGVEKVEDFSKVFRKP